MTLHDDVGLDEGGRALGHDFFTQTLLPRQPDWPASVLEGFDAAGFGGGARRRPADRFERKWLQLRLGAWRRGRLVASDVTVDLIRELDVTHCPVTRRPLTHGTGGPDDWSVDRLNNDAAYAAGNLAVIGTGVNAAKGARGFDEVLELSRRATATAGLQPVEWLRVAVLMLGPSFALKHEQAPLLPLCVPLPCRSTRLAMQQIQRLLTVDAGRPAGKNRLIRDLGSACHPQSSEQRLQLLADRVHDGLRRVTAPAQCWDIWLDDGLMDALRRWRESLDDRAWHAAAVVAGRLAAATRESAATLVKWGLASGGYLPGMRAGHGAGGTIRFVR